MNTTESEQHFSEMLLEKGLEEDTDNDVLTERKCTHDTLEVLMREESGGGCFAMLDDVMLRVKKPQLHTSRTAAAVMAA